MQFLSFNEIVILGKVGNSPAFEKNAEGVPYASFQVATEQVVSGQAGEKKTKTLWHQIVACGNLAELANDYLYRGVRVLVRGRLDYQPIETKNGFIRQTAQIFAEKLICIGGVDEISEEGKRWEEENSEENLEKLALVNHLDNVEASNARSNKEEGEGKAEKKLPTSAESEAESELANKVGEKIDEANINSGNEVKKVEENEAILMEERLKELDKEEFFANLTFPDLEFD